MSDFVLIDLASQANAVARHVQNWSENEIALWLAQRGKLSKEKDYFGSDVYHFESTLGFWIYFYLDNDQFTFVGDHISWRPSR